MKSSSCGQRVVKAVPEHKSRSERRSPRAMVRDWSRQSPSTSQGASDEVPKLWSESGRGSPRAQVKERATKSPCIARNSYNINM